MSERDVKREQFKQSSGAGKKFVLPIVITALAVIVVGGWFAFGQKASAGHEMVNVGQDGTIRFATNEFNDGKARFYQLKGQDGPIDFFLVRSSDGVVRSAFDTCDVCYRSHKGYRQEGNDMVCNNCDQHFRTDMINVVKGGCNPAPLQRQLVGETVVIAAADIEKGAWYFKGATN